MTTTTKPNIPKLGETATQVLNAAIAYPTSGYMLKFNVVCEGEWQFNRQSNNFEKCGKVRGLPIIERIEPATFEAWLLGQICQGFVTIGCGDSRNWWELHHLNRPSSPFGLAPKERMKTQRLAPLGQEPHNFECVVLQRDKQTKPYYEIARFACSGQSCLASQEEHAEKLMGWPKDFLWHTGRVLIEVAEKE